MKNSQHKSNNSKQLQYTLYRHAYSDALYYLGDSEKLKRYTRTFYNSLPDTYRDAKSSTVLKAVDDTHLTLVGDFHTCRFAQKTFTHLLELYAKKQMESGSKKAVVVALEMFAHKDNAIVKNYLDKKISEEALLALTSYETTWGFSWQNYKPILDVCRKYGFDISGIDEANLSFEAREDRLASNVYSIMQNNRDKKIFCFVGECHLATQHLPKKIQENAHLSKEKRFTRPDYNRILQNVDKYHFLTNGNDINPQAETYLELPNKQYCILNTPAWKKWRSVEAWYDRQDEDIYEALFDEADVYI